MEEGDADVCAETLRCWEGRGGGLSKGMIEVSGFLWRGFCNGKGSIALVVSVSKGEGGGRNKSHLNGHFPCRMGLIGSVDWLYNSPAQRLRPQGC